MIVAALGNIISVRKPCQCLLSFVYASCDKEYVIKLYLASEIAYCFVHMNILRIVYHVQCILWSLFSNIRILQNICLHLELHDNKVLEVFSATGYKRRSSKVFTEMTTVMGTTHSPN